MKYPYNQYSRYIKNKYGKRVQKIPVDAGFTCPNRDGSLSTGGCIYCNNQSFSKMAGTSIDIEKQIQMGIDSARKRYGASLFYVYFQSFSNTYAPIERLQTLYQSALSHEGVVGLCIGTRPDCVDSEKLDYLEKLASQYDITIEYGLESVYDETLKKINRGHDFKSFENAIKLTSGRNIKICTHLILGFPWETEEMWINSAQVLSQYPIDFIKIHNLHVVKNTKLFEIYQKNPFKIPNESEYMRILIAFLEKLHPRIIIQRLLSDTPRDMLIAPRWESSNNDFLNNLANEMIKTNTCQGKFYS